MEAIKRSNLTNIGQVALWIYFVFISLFYTWYYFDVPALGDTGCFAAVASGIREGEVLYHQIWDNKAPGIFFIHTFFQWISGNWPHYFILVPLFFQFILWSNLIPFLSRYYSTRVLILGLTLGVPFLFRLTHYETIFVSGYTEEIGIYLLLAAFFAFFKNRLISNRQACISGLYFGIALLVKEPFVFLGLPWVIYLILEKGVKSFKWFVLGTLLPITGFIFYLIFTSSIQFYLKYLEFAFLYSVGNKSSTEYYSLVLNLINKYYLDTYYFEFLLLILGFIIAILFRKRYQPLSILRYLGWLIIGSIPFVLMGNNPYGHYFVPLLFLTTFFSIFTALFLLTFLEKEAIINNSKRAWIISILATIGIAIFTIDAFKARKMNIKNLGSIEREYTDLKSIFKNKENSVYVDDAHLGRAYIYLNAKPLFRHAVPYATYYVPTGLTVLDELLSKNRDEINMQFKRNPPTYIITGKNFGYGIVYSDLSLWVNTHYKEIATLNWGGNSYRVLNYYKRQ